NGTSWTKSLITSEGTLPEMRVEKSGHARVAFNRQDGIGYAIAGTDTGSFTSSHIPLTGADDNDPKIALDGSGHARLVYENATLGYSLRSDNQTAAGWGTPGNVAVQLGDFGFDLDANGKAKVAQAEPTGIHLYTLNASTWGSTTISSVANAESVTLSRAS